MENLTCPTNELTYKFDITKKENFLYELSSDIKAHSKNCPEGPNCRCYRAMRELRRECKLMIEWYPYDNATFVWKKGFKRFYDI